MTKEEKIQAITETEWTACGLVMSKDNKSLIAKCPKEEIKWNFNAFVASHMDNHESIVYGVHFFMNFETMQLLPAAVVSNVVYGKKYRIGEMVGKPISVSVTNDVLQVPFEPAFKVIHIECQDLMIHLIKLLQPKYEQWLLETHLLGSETTDTQQREEL